MLELAWEEMCATFNALSTGAWHRFAWPSLRHELQRWTSRSGVLCRAMGDAAPLGRFDVAVLQHVLCSAAQPRELLREVRKVLKPGGLLIFVEHVPPCVPGRLAHAAYRHLLQPMTAAVCGCDLSSDAANILQSVSWQDFRLTPFELHPLGLCVPHVRGWARMHCAPACEAEFL
ncbi:unnamed protein product [Durusdinium trenchii]|uniref:Methyltransferase type 11 domain-containing protein n=2 Tax=Durusdinium trenchii TaxID=1381693 RepID=A0ABP0J4H0_9DINO